MSFSRTKILPAARISEALTPVNKGWGLNGEGMNLWE